MKAIHMTAAGPAQDALKVVNLPEPQIAAPGQIKIQIKAAGVNPIDTKLRRIDCRRKTETSCVRNPATG